MLECGRNSLKCRRHASMITFAPARERNHSRLRHSSRNLPLKLSVTPFCQGLPGLINAVPIPCATIQDNSALDTNSGPLSLRRNAGTPLELLAVGAMTVGPHLVRAARPLRSRASRGEALPRPLARHLQPSRPPQPMRPARAHAIAVAPEKDADAAIAVARILRRQLLHPFNHRRVFRGLATLIVQRRPRHREQRAGPPGRETTLPAHTQLAAGEPARSPVFCGDFLHHLDLEIPLGHQLLQPRILGLELLQAPDVARPKAAETLPPSVDRLLADTVPLGDGRYRVAIRPRMIATICSPVKRALRIAPSESGASLSRIRWAEIPGAGHSSPTLGYRESSNSLADFRRHIEFSALY
jgi:hypothetical protein